MDHRTNGTLAERRGREAVARLAVKHYVEACVLYLSLKERERKNRAQKVSPEALAQNGSGEDRKPKSPEAGEDRVAKLEKQLKDVLHLKETIAKLKAEAQEVKNNDEELKIKKNDLYESTISTYESTINGLNKEKTQLESTRNEKAEELKEQNNRIASLQRDLDSKTNENNELTNTIARLETEIDKYVRASDPNPFNPQQINGKRRKGSHRAWTTPEVKDSADLIKRTEKMLSKIERLANAKGFEPFSRSKELFDVFLEADVSTYVSPKDSAKHTLEIDLFEHIRGTFRRPMD